MGSHTPLDGDKYCHHHFNNTPLDGDKYCHQRFVHRRPFSIHEANGNRIWAAFKAASRLKNTLVLHIVAIAAFEMQPCHPQKEISHTKIPLAIDTLGISILKHLSAG